LVTISDKSYQITFYLFENYKQIPIFTIVDTLTDPNDLGTFKREFFENDKLRLAHFYESSVLKYSRKDLKVSYIKKIQGEKKINMNKIATLDIETRTDTITNKMIPICMSVYINNKTKSFLFTEA